MDASLQNFLEMRHVNEMAVLGESISLLEARLDEAQQGLDQALVNAQAAPQKKRPPPVASLMPLPQPAEESSLELDRLRSEINAKRRAMEDLVEFRDRRIAQLQAQLAEQKAVYAESHPVVANIERSLEALAVDSPQVGALRQELQELESLYLQKGGSPADLEQAALVRSATRSSAPAIIAALEGTNNRDPGEEYARSRLAAAIARYYSIVDRLESVRLERDAARASIKYRFLVVRPPMRPREPQNRPLKTVIRIAGPLSGLLLGALVAVALELRRGRVAQKWQVEHELGLPILAELPAEASLRAEGRPS